MAGKKKRRGAGWGQSGQRTAKISAPPSKRRRFSSLGDSESLDSQEAEKGAATELISSISCFTRRSRANSEAPMGIKGIDDSMSDLLLPHSGPEMEYCSTSDSDSDLFSDSEDDDLENREFSRVESAINRGYSSPAPPQLTSSACIGIGDRQEVWSIMCRKDKALRLANTDVLAGTMLTSHTRAILVDWMMEVCESVRQHRETFHLAVDYVDRYLSADKSVTVDIFQCVGTTALLIASKYEEIYPPKLDQLIEFTDDACSEEQARQMELVMLEKLQWSISNITSVHWLSVYMQLIGSKDLQGDKAHHVDNKPCVIPKYLREDYMNMAKILDIALLDVECLQFSYRELAAAVLFLCYEPKNIVQQVTGFTYESLLHVIEWMDPCYKASLVFRNTGDPLPCIPDVRSDEWHAIQTHFGVEAISKLFEEVRDQRIRATKARSKYRIVRRPGPLRPRS